MKICIIAQYAYGALKGEEYGHIGGVERQTALMSEWLCSRGHQLSIITWNEGGADVEIVNGVKIITLCKVTDGLPFLRFFIPRWTSLITALRDANAELYYHNCAEYVTGQIALWCKINNRSFIYTVASDADCEISLLKMKTKRDQLFFLYGLRGADKIICQTSKQKKLLEKNFNLQAKIIAMPGTPANGEAVAEHQYNQRKVIWVGRIQAVKRMEWLIDIAEKLPQVNFEVIGPNDHNHSYTEKILPEANKVGNIKFRGKISRKDMPEIYKNATLLLNTSIYEGFPNTYLEAWSYGVPTVCSIDPPVKDRLVDALEALISDKNKWQQCSVNSINYCKENHSINRVLKKFECEFLEFSCQQKTQRHFNQQSQKWSEYYNEEAISIAHLELQARAMFALGYLKAANLSHHDVLIDVGCGTGDGADLFQKNINCKTYGIDFASEMISKSNSKLNKKICFQVGDATKLPFNDKFASSITSLGTLEYIPDHKDAMSEFHRILKTNGQCILSVPNKHSIFRKLRSMGTKVIMPLKKLLRLETHDNGYHKQWLLNELVDELLKSGFQVTNVNFFSYGFLNPKLISAKINLTLYHYLNFKINSQGKLAKYLAHSIIINAKKMK